MTSVQQYLLFSKIRTSTIASVSLSLTKTTCLALIGRSSRASSPTWPKIGINLADYFSHIFYNQNKQVLQLNSLWTQLEAPDRLWNCLYRISIHWSFCHLYHSKLSLLKFHPLKFSLLSISTRLTCWTPNCHFWVNYKDEDSVTVLHLLTSLPTHFNYQVTLWCTGRRYHDFIAWFNYYDIFHSWWSYLTQFRLENNN